jgi:hypothetical protein
MRAPDEDARSGATERRKALAKKTLSGIVSPAATAAARLCTLGRRGLRRVRHFLFFFLKLTWRQH